MTHDWPINTMLALCTAVLVAAALFFASSIFAPLAFALFGGAPTRPHDKIETAVHYYRKPLLALFMS
jgi:predicted PurR-regulated permease PerM